jgi:hypothetical protein
LPASAQAVLAAQLPLIHEPTPSQWIVISFITLGVLAVFLRIKLGWLAVSVGPAGQA